MKKNLIVAMPIGSFLPAQGGAEVGLHNIALRLIEKGHRPIIITSYTHYKLLKKKKWILPYKVISLPPGASSFLELNQKLGFFIYDTYFKYVQWRFEIDIWHVTIGYPLGVAMTHYAKNNKVKYLIRCVGEDIQSIPNINYGMRLNKKKNDIINYYLPKSKNLVAISDSVASEYIKLKIPESSIKYIPNGVDIERFSKKINRKKIREKYEIHNDTFLFLSVSRNHPKKGFEVLLKSIVLLKKVISSNFKVLFVGKNVSLLKYKVNELGINENVILHDEVKIENNIGNANLQFPSSSLVDIYKMSDCFVLPSLIETFGIVLIEAMASGLPIITTNAQGCRDIIRNGKDGIMVDTNDAVGLSQAMQLMMSSKIKDKYSSLSYARVLSFSWDNVVEKYIKLYSEILITSD
ncbi:MAG: glycosyltransferase family 4 protein [Gammaproteobacteria bacterium]